MDRMRSLRLRIITAHSKSESTLFARFVKTTKKYDSQVIVKKKRVKIKNK